MKRTLIIGDIHGGLKALIQLLERAKVTQDDKLIFLGDYVDGWSDSAALIDYLIDLEKTNECIFIIGNHDMKFINWLKTGDKNENWVMHGGLTTIESYKNISIDTRLIHEAFIEKMKLFHVSRDNNLFIHAGYSSKKGPKKEFQKSKYNWDRSLWEKALDKAPKAKLDPDYLPKRLKLYNEIFIGHTPTTTYEEDEPMNACNVWNVDTGAAFRGKLSALDLDTKEVFQSDPVYKLYPLEKGRN